MDSTARRLTKEESRARWRELRALWNGYDPIGAVNPSDAATCDEYEAYVGPFLRLLESGATEDGLLAYVQTQVVGHIGLTWSPALSESTRSFVRESHKWFQAKWFATQT